MIVYKKHQAKCKLESRIAKGKSVGIFNHKDNADIVQKESLQNICSEDKTIVALKIIENSFFFPEHVVNKW